MIPIIIIKLNGGPPWCLGKLLIIQMIPPINIAKKIPKHMPAITCNFLLDVPISLILFSNRDNLFLSLNDRDWEGLEDSVMKKKRRFESVIKTEEMKKDQINDVSTRVWNFYFILINCDKALLTWRFDTTWLMLTKLWHYCTSGVTKKDASSFKRGLCRF